MTDLRQPFLQLLHDYRVHCEPEQRSVVDRFEAFCSAHPDCFERTNTAGHVVGSAWLVSKDGERVLLTHHRKLGRWLQLGGHADGDGHLPGVALREAQEESGLLALVGEHNLFDLDVHVIPARPEAPEHVHYDARFVVRATGTEAFAVSEESLDLAWRPVAEVAEDAGLEDAVRRMARKWLARGKARP